MWEFPFWPEQASTVAGQVDAIYIVLIILALTFALPVAALIVFFAIRYRQGTNVDRHLEYSDNLKLEVAWTLVPLLLALGVFVWAAVGYFQIMRVPSDTLDIYVIGKQWMWKIQHPSGRSEINELHVPLGQPVKLIMTSQDVIHSFFIPAFRVKYDVLPGRYTTLWFEATKTGEYHLFCAEFCGTDHSDMVGRVVVMEPSAYQTWLSGEQFESITEAGLALFTQRGCDSCHAGAAVGSRGPNLAGLFGTQEVLQNGETVVVDEAYLRESILNPQAQIVFGYEPIMPTYEGSFTEEELAQLIAYIKSLQTEEVPLDPVQGTSDEFEDQDQDISVGQEGEDRVEEEEERQDLDQDESFQEETPPGEDE